MQAILRLLSPYLLPILFGALVLGGVTWRVSAYIAGVEQRGYDRASYEAAAAKAELRVAHMQQLEAINAAADAAYQELLDRNTELAAYASRLSEEQTQDEDASNDLREQIRAWARSRARPGGDGGDSCRRGFSDDWVRKLQAAGAPAGRHPNRPEKAPAAAGNP